VFTVFFEIIHIVLPEKAQVLWYLSKKRKGLV